MFRFAFEESQKYNIGEKHVEGVEPGWFMGRKMDLADSQWNTFRSNIPILVIGMSGFLFMSDFVRRTWGVSHRIPFYNVVSFVFIVVLHGVASCWVFLIALVNCILRICIILYLNFGYSLLLLF
jgi:hypothetical protein